MCVSSYCETLFLLLSPGHLHNLIQTNQTLFNVSGAFRDQNYVWKLSFLEKCARFIRTFKSFISTTAFFKYPNIYFIKYQCLLSFLSYCHVCVCSWSTWQERECSRGLKQTFVCRWVCSSLQRRWNATETPTRHVWGKLTPKRVCFHSNRSSALSFKCWHVDQRRRFVAAPLKLGFKCFFSSWYVVTLRCVIGFNLPSVFLWTFCFYRCQNGDLEQNQSPAVVRLIVTCDIVFRVRSYRHVGQAVTLGKKKKKNCCCRLWFVLDVFYNICLK